MLSSDEGAATKADAPRVQLLGSGSILREVIDALTMGVFSSDDPTTKRQTQLELMATPIK